MEIIVDGLQEAVLEVIQVEEYLAVAEFLFLETEIEVQPLGTLVLYLGQKAYGLEQQRLLLIAVIAGVASRSHGLEEGKGAQVLLYVAHPVFADRIDLGDIDALRGEMPCHTSEAEILRTVGADYAYAGSLSAGGTVRSLLRSVEYPVVTAVAACRGQGLYLVRSLAGPGAE